jgi:Amt family ammonium transporter
VHFVGGWIGCLFIGFFATVQADGGAYVKHEGLFYGGGGTQLLAQFEGAGIVTIWSFVIAFIIGSLLKVTGLLRLKKEDELEGIDIAEHKESAYDFTGGGGSTGAPSAFAQAGIGGSAGAPATESAPAPANV